MSHRVRRIAVFAGLALSLAAIVINRHPEMVLGTLVFIVPTWGYLLLLLSPGPRHQATARSQPAPAISSAVCLLASSASDGATQPAPEALHLARRLPGRAA
ncbi:MAG: hypothetical protein HYV08_05865 [Deltaproteobacteria bacterium]|nr:hypothetical protein [Deltaproteobacteria bacterium]MBI3078435.1 hypothetical protein [Deltaproteobacteria bacterium]